MDHIEPAVQLGRYEARLERTIFRAMRELDRLQDRRMRRERNNDDNNDGPRTPLGSCGNRGASSPLPIDGGAASNITVMPVRPTATRATNYGPPFALAA